MNVKRGKNGADVRFLHEAIVSRLWWIDQICRHHAPDEYDPVITSGMDGIHSKGSLHYNWRAIDVRTWYMKNGRRIFLDDNTQEKIAADLRQQLGRNFDVVIHTVEEWENGGAFPHFHIEYDPMKTVKIPANVIGLHGPP